ATPHSGDRRTFASLCGMGARDDSLIVFRRTRRDVRLGADRRIHLLQVRPNRAEQKMHALIAALNDAVRHAWQRDPTGHEGGWLALTVLNKRALSSARSLEQTLERRLTALAFPSDEGGLQFCLPLDDDETEADRPPELAGLALGDPRREGALLAELADAARAAARDETKIDALRRFLRRVAEPVVVFTEYRDTLQHLQRAIGRPSAVVHGGLGRDARNAALDTFARGRRTVLLATDAAGEGLNLHQIARTVVNLELPWNPMRLEQRIGRVDRIGQRRTVHAVHLIARDTGEARLLERLRARIALAQMDIVTADPIGERAIARFVIDGTSLGETAFRSESQGADVDEPRTGVPVPVVLTAAAETEATRLTDARRFTQACDERSAARRDAEGAWLMFSRASLRERFILLTRVCCEDASGRLMESAIVPVAVHCARGHGPIRDRRLIELMVDAVMPDVRAAVDAASMAWRESALACTRLFFDTRLSRERAIAATFPGAPAGALQPGLFDRRADHERRAAHDVIADVVGDVHRRIAAIEQASTVCARPAQLLLILAP